MQWFQVQAERATFVHGIPFLLGRIIQRQRLLRVEYLAVIFLKMNKACPSFQRRQLTVFVASDKIQTCKQKSEFQKFLSTIQCSTREIFF